MLLFAALASASCSSSKETGVCGDADDREGCLTKHYLADYAPAPFTLCDSTSKATVDGKKEVAFVLGDGVIDLEAQTAGRRLQRYYDAFGLKFFVREQAGSAPFKYLLSGTEAALRTRAGELGISPDKQPTSDAEAVALERVVAEVLGKNLRELVLSRGPKVENRIDIVVVDGIVDPAVQRIVAGTSVVLGMGLSPALFRSLASNDPKLNYFDLYGLPQDFTPVFFVGQDDVRRLTPLLGDSIMAHELGHAMGLVHVEDTSNLMYRAAGAVACLPGLNDAQVDALKVVTGNATGGVATKTWSFASPPFASSADHTEVPPLVAITRAYARALTRGNARAAGADASR